MDNLRVLFFLKDEEYIQILKKNLPIEFWKIGIEAEIIFRNIENSNFIEFKNLQPIDLVFYEFNLEKFFKIIESLSLIRGENYKKNISILFEKESFNEKYLLKFFETGGTDVYFIEDIISKVVDYKFLIRKKNEIYKYLGIESLNYKKEEIINKNVLEDFLNSLSEKNFSSFSDLSYIYNGLDNSDKNKFLEKIKTNASKFYLNGLNNSKDLIFNGEGLIGVWDNPEFSSELAYVISKKTKKKILVIDLDRINPSMDLFLNKIDSRKNFTYFEKFNLFYFQELFLKDKINETSILNCSMQSKNRKNLYFIFASKDITKFEYYSNEMIIEVIENALKKFDIVILNLNNFIYDAYTCIGLIKSDICIIPRFIDIQSLREYTRYINFLSEKQGLEKSKFYFIFFEFNKKYCRELSFYKELLGNQFLGKISFCLKRKEHRNYRKAYVNSMRANIQNEYLNILKKLKI